MPLTEISAASPTNSSSTSGARRPLRFGKNGIASSGARPRASNAAALAASCAGDGGASAPISRSAELELVNTCAEIRCGCASA